MLQALKAWLAEGARTALLLRPPRRDLADPGPAVVVALFVAVSAVAIALERSFYAAPVEFNWRALGQGGLGSLITVWLCWWLAGTGTARRVALLAAQAPFAFAAGTLALHALRQMPGFEAALGGWAGWLAGWLPMAWWALAGAAALLRDAAPAPVPRRAFAAAGFVATMALPVVFGAAPHWYARVDETVQVPPARLDQAAFEAQAAALQEGLGAVAAQRPGVADVYVLTFAPYADETVFARESRLVADVMAQRFDAAGRTLELVNTREAGTALPWATPLNLERAIRAVAAVMDREEDVLFLHLTSHGARDGRLAASFWPLDVEPVTPELLRRWLDEAGVRQRVVSISACYSGSWLPGLAGPHTLVMTAADAEHTSYGCGRGAELTYFGRALYDEELRRTHSFEAAHAAARATIERREREAGKPDGFSNPQISMGEALRPRLEALAQRLAP